MRRVFWFGIALMILIVGAGCAPKTTSTQDGQAVLFDGLTNLFDDGVYYQGARIGSIQSTQIGPANVTLIKVALSSEFASRMGNHVIFYAHGGRLMADRLQAFGAALEQGAPVCGFVSKAEFNWFKFKTLLDNRVGAARQRALALQARMG